MSIAPDLLARLHCPALLRAAGFVAGDWLARSDSGQTFTVANPATGAVIATLPDLGPAETARAIDAAYRAQKDWAAATAQERAAVLRVLRELMLGHIDDLATIITAEMGKPLAEARKEVLSGAAYVEWFAEEAKRIYGDVIPAPEADRRALVIKQPVGVCGAITPWNFPCSTLARKLAPALATGCAMVAKPAEQTPLSALALAALAEQAGLPPGLFSVLPASDGAAIGQEMCRNKKLRKLSFTGSTEVGAILLRQGAGRILKMSLELGGNAPFIVFDDADLDAAVAGAMAAKFRNSGQTCVSANRIYVQAGLHDAFAEKLAQAVGRLVVGDGFAPGVSCGPLIDAAALTKVEAHVGDARAQGATVLCGGEPSPTGALFYRPTVLTGVTAAMRIAREETFGPVAPLFRFEDEAEVIEQANATDYGLAAYFFARDVGRVWRVAEALDFGMVGINTGSMSSEAAPFGGVKQSGQGREGSKYGAEDYLELKYMCLGGL